MGTAWAGGMVQTTVEYTWKDRLIEWCKQEPGVLVVVILVLGTWVALRLFRFTEKD